MKKLQAGRFADVDRLQRELLEQGQVITYFEDIDRQDPAFAAIQYFGTKGFFDTYEARSKDPVDRTTAREWFAIATGRPRPGGEPGGSLTWRGLEEWIRDAGDAAATEWRPPAESPRSMVSRGELCQVLYNVTRNGKL